MSSTVGMYEASFEAQIDLQAQLDTLKRERDELITGRTPNLPQNIAAFRKQNEKLKAQLKSDLKKSNTFVKKLKTITSEGIVQCIRDTESVNLNLFVSEIVNAVVATTYKATDVPGMVKLCVCMHQKYEEFCEPLLLGLKQALITPPAEDDPEAGKRKRIQIRFMVELYQAGLLAEDEYFIRLLKNLLGKGKSGTKVDLQGISTFVKYGAETVFGYIPKRTIDLAARLHKKVSEMPIKTLTAPKVHEDLQRTLQETYEQLSTDLIAAHKAYHTKESKMEKDKLIHGSITEQKQAEFDAAKRLYEKLLSIVTTLSECMNQPMPVLEVEKEEQEGGGGLSVWDGARESAEDLAAAAAAGGLFGDAETRAFYEELPDLLAAVPLTVLGLTPEQADALRAKWTAEAEQLQQNAPGAGGAGATGVDGVDGGEVGGDGHDGAAGGDVGGDVDAEEKGDTYDATAGAGAGAEEASPSSANDPEDVAEAGDENRAAKLNALLNERLPEVINRQKADEFCVSFCYLATKNARKRLVQALFRIPRFRAELTPFYARIVASLNRLYPELAPALLDALKREFYGMLKTKNQTPQAMDGKLKTARYLGELVKFRLAPPIVAFRCFRTLFGDFSNQNAQLLAVLLETCGRFLYLVPYTHDTMCGILDTMLRLRRMKNLDLHMQTLLEAAYFAVKPPERANKTAKAPLSIVQQYARHLIQVKLEEPRVSVEDVIRSLRRLPWKDDAEQVGLHITKASLLVARSKYVSIPNLADCLSGLGEYHPNVVVMVVDRILEEVQRALETPYKREIQRILGLVRLLGELYNFTAISSGIIFDLLYHLIDFGHADGNVAAVLVERAERVCAAVQGTASAAGRGEGSGGSGVTPAIITAAAAATRIRFDPRIPTDLDPPSDLFRAQVVCELLNTCGMYFVSGRPKDKMTRFLVFFQRYLLTKQFIPLHVEFAILDTFDNLEEEARQAALDAQRKPVGRGTSKLAALTAAQEGPHFPRFETLEEAQKAVDVYEQVPEEERLRLEHEQEKEAEEERQRQQDEDDGDGDADGDGDGGSQAGDSGSSDEGSDTGDSDSGSDTSSSSDGDGESGDSDGEGEDEQKAENDRSEMLAKQMMEKLRIAEEDEEFEKAFKQVLQESTHHVSSKAGDVNRMVIPAALPKPKNAFRTTEEEDEEVEGGGGGSGAAGGKKGVMFRLLSRDSKGRFETRALQVPEDCKMAVRLAEADEANRAERLRIKERVLQLNQLAAEEELAEERMRARNPILGAVLASASGSATNAPGTTATTATGGGVSVGSVGDRSHGGVYRPAGVSAGGGDRRGDSGSYTAGPARAAGEGAYRAAGAAARQVQGNAANVSFGGYARATYSSAPSVNTNSGRAGSVVVRGDEVKRPDTLNLDEFLAESEASDLRKLSSKKNGRL